MENQKKKHIFVIGAQKSGTTWLQHVFDNDPRFELHMDQELNFFEKGFSIESSEAADRYVRYFPVWNMEHISVEVTPTYLYRHEVIEHIQALSANLGLDARIIVLLREPAERAFSEYQMQLSYRKATGSFAEVLAEKPALLDRGRYGKHLAPWLAAFGRERVLVLFFDDIRDSPNTVLEKISKFLDIQNSFSDRYIRARVNSGGVDKYPAISGVRRISGLILRWLGLHGVLHKLKSVKAIQKVEQMNKTKISINKQEKENIMRMMESDIEDLDGLIGLGCRAKKWGYCIKANGESGV